MNDLERKPARVGGIVYRIFGFLLLVLSFAAAWLIMDFQSFRHNPVSIPAQGTTLFVTQGSSLNSIAARLAQQGIVDHPRYLVWMGRYLKLDAKLKAGEFDLQPGSTPEQLLHQLTDGKVVQYSLALIEGQTFAEMLQRIEQSELLQHTLEDTGSDAVMTAIGYPGLQPEGRFLPETYHFPRGFSDEEFLRRAYIDMDRFLQNAWSERETDLPLKSPYEALILASIVEKETGLASERPRIAGVFIQRLRKGMRLQTDPTVIYGMGDAYDGDIRFRDLKKDTPYNTYTRKGLPPTPIAMPGKDAILAVMHPTEGKELYFVARGDGSHHFSATLREHENMVDRYIRKRKPR